VGLSLPLLPYHICKCVLQKPIIPHCTTFAVNLTARTRAAAGVPPTTRDATIAATGFATSSAPATVVAARVCTIQAGTGVVPASPATKVTARTPVAAAAVFTGLYTSQSIYQYKQQHI